MLYCIVHNILNFPQLAHRYHGRARVVRQQAEPEVGHERGVGSA